MNNIKRTLIGLLVLLMLVSPVMALAQDDDELPEGWVEFVDEDEYYSIAVPEDWAVQLDPEDPTALYVTNSEDLLERIANDDPDDDGAVPGDQAIVLTVIPAELFAMMGLELTDDTTSEELITALGEMMMTGEGEDVPELGEVIVDEDSEGTPFGFQEFVEAEENLEGYIFAAHQDGVILFGIAAAYTGEFADAADTLLDILDSLEVNFTADDLMNMMMGGEMEATEEPSN